MLDVPLRLYPDGPSIHPRAHVNSSSSTDAVVIETTLPRGRLARITATRLVCLTLWIRLNLGFRLRVSLRAARFSKSTIHLLYSTPRVNL